VLRRVIGKLPGLTLQAKSEQSRYKLSYHYDSNSAPSMEEILTLLRQQELSANCTLSSGQFLDFVPARASKGQALRYIAQQWHIPLERILATGGSGADEDMLRGNTLGVVVANRHCEELSDSGRYRTRLFRRGFACLGYIGGHRALRLFQSLTEYIVHD